MLQVGAKMVFRTLTMLMSVLRRGVVDGMNCEPINNPRQPPLHVVTLVR